MGSAGQQAVIERFERWTHGRVDLEYPVWRHARVAVVGCAMARNLETAARKVRVTARLIQDEGGSGRILVVGCGDGREAGHLARLLGSETIGIDIGAEFEFAHREAAPARLMQMDAQSLDFPEDSFDVIYSFHVLEHLPDPERALREMRRVLRPGGMFLVGTPNKNRAIGYIGSAAPIRDRLRWNINDWSARLLGRWSNAKGAHAGFTAGELIAMCRSAFGDGRDVSDDYYLQLYASRSNLIRRLRDSGLRRWAYPAIYVIGRSL